MLLNARSRVGLLELLLYIYSHDRRLEPPDAQASFFAPVKEERHRLGICEARVLVSDVRGEKLDESPSSISALRGDDFLAQDSMPNVLLIGAEELLS